jgi:hypothetical protein
LFAARLRRGANVSGTFPGLEQLHVQRLDLRAGRGAELLSEQGAQLLETPPVSLDPHSILAGCEVIHANADQRVT